MLAAPACSEVRVAAQHLSAAIIGLMRGVEANPHIPRARAHLREYSEPAPGIFPQARALSDQRNNYGASLSATRLGLTQWWAFPLLLLLPPLFPF